MLYGNGNLEVDYLWYIAQDNTSDAARLYFHIKKEASNYHSPFNGK
jgi:hypothetical protein